MLIDAFDFELPDSAIALRPASPRDSARLLCVSPVDSAAPFADHRVRDLPNLLREGDALIVNNTKVIAARLRGVREREGGTQATIEATLIERLAATVWRVLLRPAKRVRVGDMIKFGATSATVQAREAGAAVLEFDLPATDMEAFLVAQGDMPLPPYIARKRAPDAQDRIDYQTHFARHDGAVAAPTAGLHFTPALLARLKARGVACYEATLHVGAGTFLPVKTDDPRDHKMHAEWGELAQETADAINATRAAGGRIICVGTTSLRLLESAADANGVVSAFSGTTDIFITPESQIRACDMLLTNFHLPRSTLFMLVAGFSGLELMHQAYTHALASGYRFYSYGDACLLEKK